MKTDRAILITGVTGSVGEAVLELITRSFPKNKIYGTYNSANEKSKFLEEKYNIKCYNIDASNKKKLIDSIDVLPNDISIIINAHGVNLSSDYAMKTQQSTIDKTLEINTYFPLLIAQKFIPYMISQQWGRIVNVNSIWGIRGSLNNLSYTMSKHALTGITKTLALEYFEHGITVNDVCPGPIESQMIIDILKKRANKEDRKIDDIYSDFCNSLRMKRMVTPKEVASLIIFLCSENASGINGTSIPVDCGMTI